jgi:hypothetical protein
MMEQIDGFAITARKNHMRANVISQIGITTHFSENLEIATLVLHLI